MSLSHSAASASIEDAKKAYALRDYDTAFQHYQYLAEVGQASALYQLGLMHYSGQGTTQNKVEAVLWLFLATEQAYEDSEQLSRAILKELTPEQITELKGRLTSMAKNFSQAAVQEMYMPELYPSKFEKNILINSEEGLLFGLEDEDGLTNDVFAEADNMIEVNLFPFDDDEDDSSFDVDYITRSIQSRNDVVNPFNRPYFLIVDYRVAPDGTVRDVEVVQSFGYTKRALRKFKEAKYPSPEFDGQLVNSRQRRALGIAQSDISLRDMMDKYDYVYRGVKGILAKKDSEEAKDEYKYAVTLMNFEGLWREEGEIDAKLQSASEKGYANAQYVYADKLYREQNNIQKSIYWMTEAAKQGIVNAEYRLGEMFLESPWVKRDEKKALFWLDRAAKQGHVFALRRSAHLRLLAEDESLHDPKVAMTSLDRISIVEKMNPELLYLKARGLLKVDRTNRPKAVIMIRQAIMRGDQLGWDTSDWNEVLMGWTTGGSVTVQDDIDISNLETE
nr:hypothetical protein [Echinimonas agarilytica]